MNQILILKNEAYLTGDAGVISNLKDINTLKPGAFGFVLDGKVLYGNTTPVAALQKVQMIVGISKGVNAVGNTVRVQSSVPIDRRSVLSINYEKYKAPVTQVVEVGPFNLKDSAGNELEGDVGITINDNSFVRTIQTNQIRISEYRLKTQTLSSILDKIVDRINNGTGIPNQQVFNSFCTAEKTGTADANYKIKLTMKSEHVDLSIAVDGLFSFAPVVTTRKPVFSLGAGADVLRTEKEYNGNLGDGGYWGYNEGYFSKPLEASIGVNYDIIQIKFQGEHDTPQNRVRAAVNHLMIAVDTTATATVASLLAGLDAIFGTAFTSDKGTIVVSKDEADETDNTPPPVTP